jgi:hypothetical protein
LNILPVYFVYDSIFKVPGRYIQSTFKLERIIGGTGINEEHRTSSCKKKGEERGDFIALSPPPILYSMEWLSHLEFAFKADIL